MSDFFVVGNMVLIMLVEEEIIGATGGASPSPTEVG